MKNYLLNATLPVVIFLLSLMVPVSQLKARTIKISNNIENFRRVMVKGPVEVLLIQRKQVGISYADDNTGQVKVIQTGESLLIEAQKNAPAKIILYVNELYRISGDNGAKIKSESKLHFNFLQVMLQNHASAELDLAVNDLLTQTVTHSTLKLGGTAWQHTLLHDGTANTSLVNFSYYGDAGKLTRVADQQLKVIYSSNQPDQIEQ